MSARQSFRMGPRNSFPYITLCNRVYNHVIEQWTKTGNLEDLDDPYRMFSIFFLRNGSPFHSSDDTRIVQYIYNFETGESSHPLTGVAFHTKHVSG